MITIPRIEKFIREEALPPALIHPQEAESFINFWKNTEWAVLALTSIEQLPKLWQQWLYDKQTQLARGSKLSKKDKKRQAFSLIIDGANSSGMEVGEFMRSKKEFEEVYDE